MTSALAIGCLAVGTVLAVFVLANNVFERLSFAGGIVLLVTMAAFPMTVWLTMDRQESPEEAVVKRNARWQVRFVAFMWIVYSMLLLIVVQRFLGG